MTLPRILFLGWSQDSKEITEYIGRRQLATESSKRLRDCFELISAKIQAGDAATLLDIAVLEVIKTKPDLILVSLDVDHGDSSIRNGRSLALGIKKRLKTKAVGVYTKYSLAPFDKVAISSDRYAIVLEEIRKTFDGALALTGDDWYDILDRAILSIHGESAYSYAEHAQDQNAESSLAKSVLMRFELPDEVKIACSRYLLYFVELLKDLGVDATFDLREKGGEVTFIVTPTSTQTALDYLTIALEAYLYLPSARIQESEKSYSQDETVLRLISKIRELQSELAYADATILAQQRTIDAQSQLSNGTVLIDGLKEIKPEPKDRDVATMFGGFVEIDSIEYKGFAFKLGKLINYVKDLKRLSDHNDG
jgi:hypothetical protein